LSAIGVYPKEAFLWQCKQGLLNHTWANTAHSTMFGSTDCFNVDPVFVNFIRSIFRSIDPTTADCGVANYLHNSELFSVNNHEISIKNIDTDWEDLVYWDYDELQNYDEVEKFQQLTDSNAGRMPEILCSIIGDGVANEILPKLQSCFNHS